MKDICFQPSCADDYDPESLSVAQALGRIDTITVPVTGFEQVALRTALGRVLAENIHSPLDVPAHTNAAMDGYAIRSVDLPETETSKLSVIGTALAGVPFKGKVEPGTAVRIMTGAVLPEGADCVVMQERVKREAEWVFIGAGNKANQNIRKAGEDLATGKVVLESGKLLTPADIGLLASLGIAELRVLRRLRVAFFSTGDELCSIGETLSEGQIYDSNRYTLYGMLTRLGVDIIDMGVVRDRQDALKWAFQEAACNADAVITSGGVSVGEADFVKTILTSLGEVNFWKIAMKPGRPMAFGRIKDAVFFGLPGNPVSVMVTFYEFVLPALKRMMGQKQSMPIYIKVNCTTPLRKRPGRREFQRGILEYRSDGTLQVRGTGNQGSGILSTMSRANCFIVLPEECGNIEPGSDVDVQPFEGLI
jgi:molybdopterin molybdotransferase